MLLRHPCLCFSYYEFRWLHHFLYAHFYIPSSLSRFTVEALRLTSPWHGEAPCCQFLTPLATNKFHHSNTVTAVRYQVRTTVDKLFLWEYILHLRDWCGTGDGKYLHFLWVILLLWLQRTLFRGKHICLSKWMID